MPTHELTLRVTDRLSANRLKNRLSFGLHPIGIGPVKLMRWNPSEDGWDLPVKLTMQIIDRAPKPVVEGVFQALKAAGSETEGLFVDGKEMTV